MRSRRTRPAGTPRAPGVFRSLRIRNYRLYFTGSVASSTGLWMQRVAQDWLVLGLTDGDAFALGMVTFLQFAPTLIFSMPGGLLADRYDKRTVLRCTQASVALTAATLATLDLTGVVAMWHVYLLAAIVGITAALEAPSRVSIASELVPSEDVPNAVGLNASAFNSARLIGPALAGVMIGLVGTGPVFILNAVSSVVIIILLGMVDPTATYGVRRAGRERGQIREAFRYVRGRPELVLTILLVTLVSIFGFNLQVLIPLVATAVFDQDAEGYGLLASALAAGTLTGALIAANRRAKPRLRALVASALAFGVLEVAIAWIGSYWLFALMLIPVGAVSLYFINSANAMVQLSVDSEVRGRVMALWVMFFLGAGAFGAPLVGWLTRQYGVELAIAVCGAATALAAIVIGWLLARRMGGLHVGLSIRGRPHVEVRLGDRLLPVGIRGLPTAASAVPGQDVIDPVEPPAEKRT